MTIPSRGISILNANIPFSRVGSTLSAPANRLDPGDRNWGSRLIAHLGWSDPGHGDHLAAPKILSFWGDNPSRSSLGLPFDLSKIAIWITW